MWRRHVLLLHRLLLSYRDHRRCRGSHCHGDVDGTAGSRRRQHYKTYSVNSETYRTAKCDCTVTVAVLFAEYRLSS